MKNPSAYKNDPVSGLQLSNAIPKNKDFTAQDVLYNLAKNGIGIYMPTLKARIRRDVNRGIMRELQDKKFTFRMIESERCRLTKYSKPSKRKSMAVNVQVERSEHRRIHWSKLGINAKPGETVLIRGL